MYTGSIPVHDVNDVFFSSPLTFTRTTSTIKVKFTLSFIHVRVSGKKQAVGSNYEKLDMKL